MNTFFNENLGSLIKLENKKIVNKSNKKLISTSIFLPELPSVTLKTSIYILGTIKLIETFKKYMGNKWILRVYYDSMFDKGIKRKNLDNVVLNDIKENKSNTNDDSSYEYYYDSIKDQEKITNNKIYLKKIVKLMHLYLQRVSNSSDPKYSNIELVSYDCPSVSTSNLIGHYATFGSIMRFLALYDESVSTVFCINSRDSINSLLKVIINEWETSNKTLFLFQYDNQAVGKLVKNELNTKAYDIRNKEEYEDEDLLFIDFVDTFYEFKYNVLNKKRPPTFDNLSHKPNDMLKYISFGNKDYKEYSLSIAAGIFGIKKSDKYFEEKLIFFSKLLTYFIKSKNEFNYGIDEVLTKTILGFEGGVNNNNKINNENIKQFYRTITKCSDIYNLFNCRMSFLQDKNNNKICINEFINKSFYRVLDSYIPQKYSTKELMSSIELIDIGILNTRSIYSRFDYKTKKLNKGDRIYKVVCKKKNDLDLTIGLLSHKLDESKRLFLIDSSQKNRLNFLLDIEAEMGDAKKKISDFYTIIDLNEVNQRGINNMIDDIIDYYDKLSNNEVIEYKHPTQIGKRFFSYSSTRSSSNNSKNYKKTIKKYKFNL